MTIHAKNFGGNVTTQLLPLVAGAAGLECNANNDNEAAAGKDVCDTHFCHQQARVTLLFLKAVVDKKCQVLNNCILLWQQNS